ncbi:MFS transporter [Terriglobus aquaticus]|uniref:MFS transporter n=1 Tax=Terriglobus aquaticus TaxID=940139 RepID=A0ABW9KNX8_9BACT|nr:MFS transporter [Terriglobus aquaticus]
MLKNRALLALAVAAFGIGTTEFIILGLLPDLARDFSVSIPKAGTLVTAYALSVTLGSPWIALLVSRWERRRALVFLMGMFVVGNALCALAPNYGLLLGARILTALSHGAFFGIGSIVAAGLVPPEKRAQAIALMFTGLTLANVLGVPAGTALGQHFGWRMSFAALIPIGLMAGAGLLAFVPRQWPETIDLRSEFRTVLRPGVQVVLTMSTLSSTAMFCVLTYITPLLENVTGLTPHAVTKVLVIFGVAITIGNLVGARLSDWRQIPALWIGYGTLLAIFLTLPFAVRSVVPSVIAVCAFGMVNFAAGAPLQARIVEQAKGAPNLPSTLNQGAFNLGNALGASLGGLVLTRGFGYGRLSYASAAVTTVVLLAVLIAARLERRDAVAA